MLKKLLCFIWVFLGFVQNGMGGEAKSDTIKIYYLEGIVVTATRIERAVKDLSATVSIVGREEIEMSNANSCADILNTLPGVFVQKTGDFGRADVNIRGLGQRGRRMMVLTDGRPVKMGLFGCTVTHSLPLNNVERIEVVRGPLSVLYGSDALGGVINIITRKPTKPIEANCTFSYSTHNTYIYQIQVGGLQGPFNLYITTDKRKGNGHLDNSAYDGSDYTFRIGYEIINNVEATLTGKYFEGYKEEPLKATDPDTLISDIWNGYKRGAVDLTITGKLKKLKWLCKGYHNFGDHEFSDGWNSRDLTNGALVHGSIKFFSHNELTLGAEFRKQGGERFSEPLGEWDKKEYAVFFHDEQIFLEKFILTFGGRYNWDEISGKETCPQVGLVIHPREGTILRGSVNKGFRSPQLNELYMFPPSNEDLRPERVWNYEVGINQRIVKGLYVDFVGYYMKGDNIIQMEANPNPPPGYIFQNTGEFEFSGIETGLILQIGNKIQGNIYYTYLNSGEKTSGRPRNKVNLSLRYTIDKFTLSIIGQYVTDYFAEDSSQVPIEEYFITDGKVSYEFPFGLKPFLAINNIFNTEYEIYTDLPGSGAGIYKMAGLVWTTGLNFKF